MTEPTRRQLLVLACVAAAIVYVNALWNGFALDDVYIIAGNARVRDLTDLRAIWLTPYWPTFGVELGLWRPLAIFMYALEWAACGGQPWVFHLANLLLHTAVTATSFLLLERLTSTRAAFVGALLFAVHPLHTEAVANVVGQAELIAALATLAACVVHTRRPEGVDVAWRTRLQLLLLFLIAILAKENAVVLPALLVACDFAQRRVMLTRAGILRYVDAMLMTALLLAAALAAYMLVRFGVLDGHITGTDPGPTLPFLHGDDRVLNALRAFPELIRLNFFPLDLASDYSPAVILPVDSVTPMVAVGAVLLVGILVLACTTPWFPALGFPAAWFLISIITVSNLFFPIGVLIAERTLYLPSFALCALAAYTWQHALPRASDAARRVAPLLAGAVVVVLAAATIIRNPDWDSTTAVQAALIRDHPENYRSQWVQGAAASAAGDPRRALGHYQLAYRIYSHDSQFLTEFGLFMLSRSRPADARTILEQAWALNSYVPRTATFLAYAQLATGHYREALDMAGNAQRIGAYTISTLPIIAHAKEGLGDRTGAVAAWRVLLGLPGGNSWKNRAWLARALAVAGLHGEARTEIEKASPLADDAGRSRLDALATAMTQGCFDGIAPGETPDCDPLGDYFIVRTQLRDTTATR